MCKACHLCAHFFDVWLLNCSSLLYLALGWQPSPVRFFLSGRVSSESNGNEQLFLLRTSFLVVNVCKLDEQSDTEKHVQFKLKMDRSFSHILSSFFPIFSFTY